MMKPPSVDRRQMLKAGLVMPYAMGVGSAASAAPMGGVDDAGTFGEERLFADVATYARAGNKQSGGAGDRQTADWTAQRLRGAGFAVERQAFQVPWFKTDACELTLNGQKIPLIAQPLAVTTGAQGVSAPLRLVEHDGRLDDAIAVIRLPYRRWSSLLDRAVRGPVTDALARGAVAILLVTTGPTGEALLLNTPADVPLCDKPMALLAPRLAGPVVEAARHGAHAVLVVTGQGGRRPAENIIGRIIRPGRPWLVVSTPRSGWTDCVGERGPGLAIWLALADWMPRAFPGHSLLFVCNSGHEYENLGASHIVKDVGPPPSQTDFWLHLGANVATRDYQETPAALLPLPSADPFRFLMTSAAHVERARAIFKGLPGLEMAYPTSEGTAGELSEVVKAGYPHHAGIFGAHRYHHAPSDQISVIAPQQVYLTARAVSLLLTEILTSKSK